MLLLIRMSPQTEVGRSMSNRVGYTVGCFDLFHAGHLNFLQKASNLCDKLIVGITTDEVSFAIKQRMPIIPELDRLNIVQNIKGVSVAVIVDNDDKYREWEKYRYDLLIVGDDHRGEAVWTSWESKLAIKGVKVIYIPYTKGVSTSALIQRIKGNSCVM